MNKEPIKVELKFYHPKGGMCMTCNRINEDCNFLPFKEMPLIKITEEGYGIVRCTMHLRNVI